MIDQLWLDNAEFLDWSYGYDQPGRGSWCVTYEVLESFTKREM